VTLLADIFSCHASQPVRFTATEDNPQLTWDRWFARAPGQSAVTSRSKRPLLTVRCSELIKKMDTQSTGASDPDIETHGEDQGRRGIDVAGRHLVSNVPVFGNAGESSPTVTTDKHPERLRTPELPPSGLAPQGTRLEGSVVPGSKSVAALSPEAGNGQVVGGRYRHSCKQRSGQTSCADKRKSHVRHDGSSACLHILSGALHAQRSRCENKVGS